MEIKLNVIDWRAIQSIVTFIAILVALFPTWLNYRNRLSMGKNLRIQIASQLMVLRPILSVHRLGEIILPTADVNGLKINQPINALKSLFSQAHILKPNEHDKVIVLMINLSAIEPLPFTEIDLVTRDQITELIDSIISLFQQSGFLHDKKNIQDLPWPM